MTGAKPTKESRKKSRALLAVKAQPNWELNTLRVQLSSAFDFTFEFLEFVDANVLVKELSNRLEVMRDSLNRQIDLALSDLAMEEE